MRHTRWIPSVIACLLLWSSTPSADQDVVALSAFDYVIEGRNELVGVAVREDGTRFVSDRAAGIVYQITPTGTVTTAATGLNRPAGLALDGNQSLLIAEEGAGRLLRLDAGGQIATIATGIKTPRWIAVAAGGALYVSAHRLTSPDGTDPSEGRVIIRIAPGAVIAEVATGIRSVEGVLFFDGALVVASKGLITAPGDSGVLLRYAVNPDGTLGVPAYLATTGLKQPKGLTGDVIGALYVSSKELLLEDDRLKRAIAKVQSGQLLSDFAANLFDPQGLALGPDGSLYAADGLSGRLYRFRAPAAPNLGPLPQFTNQESILVTGTTEAGAKVSVLLDDAEQATAIASGTGEFSVGVTLHANAINEISVFATPHAGRGLTSPPASAELTQDAIGPSVVFIAPATSYVRNTTSVQVRATDGGSEVSVVTLTAADQNLSPSFAPAPPAPELVASAPWDTRTVADGTHSLRAVVSDRAGNQTGPVTIAVTVDNTAPDTLITEGPSGVVSSTTANFVFSGTDNLTPPQALVFAWRLDAGPWSSFGATTSVTLSQLAAGPHRFEVRARDTAGSEDPTPAVRDFTVTTVSIVITSPGAGATVSAGSLLVQGTIQSDGNETAVFVNGVAALSSGSAFAVVLPVTTATTALRAEIKTSAGAIASHTVPISVVTTGSTGTFLATPEAGIAPLQATFSFVGGTPTSVELDADGDGSADFVGSNLSDALFSYPASGFYFPTLKVYEQGVARTFRTVVHVVDRATIDTLLRAKWATFRAALGSGDVNGALDSIVAGEKDHYRAVFLDLGSTLPGAAATLGDIHIVEAGAEIVEYVTMRERDGIRSVYFIYFARDTDGLWKILRM